MRYARLLPLVLAFGCTQNDTSITIDNFVGLRLSAMCVAAPMGTPIPFGILDVTAAQAVGQGYLVAPIVGNHLVDRVGSTGVQLDAILLQRFNVRLTGDSVT